MKTFEEWAKGVKGSFKIEAGEYEIVYSPDQRWAVRCGDYVAHFDTADEVLIGITEQVRFSTTGMWFDEEMAKAFSFVEKGDTDENV